MFVSGQLFSIGQSFPVEGLKQIPDPQNSTIHLVWWPPFPTSKITDYKVVYCLVENCSSTTQHYATNLTNVRLADVQSPNEKYKILVFGYTGDTGKDDVAMHQATPLITTPSHQGKLRFLIKPILL